MPFLKNPYKVILLLLLSFLTFVASADEAADQTEPRSTETLTLAQDDETLLNDSNGKWNFIDHQQEGSDITDIQTEEYSEDYPQENNYDAITIYIDASWGYRTERAAINITERHQEHAARGYQFVDLELYLEDSDLKGFFVTYEKLPN